MPCNFPYRGYRKPDGSVRLHRPFTDGPSVPVDVPCQGCLGCVEDRARGWAFRAWLESQEHDESVFVTLTYSDDWVPLTLSKQDPADYIRSLRKLIGREFRDGLQRRFRYFGSAEYGEQFRRPHYHLILFGLGMADKSAIQGKWPYGHAQVDSLTASRLSYTAGYTQKKISYAERSNVRIAPHSGCPYRWQPPFRLMSRRPGIGAAARDRWPQMFRSHVVLRGGVSMAVPSFLHDGWLKIATDNDIEMLDRERLLYRRANPSRQTADSRLARHDILMAKLFNRAQRRSLES